MTTVSAVALSFSSSIYRCCYDFNHHPFSNPTFPNHKHELHFHTRCRCSMKRLNLAHQMFDEKPEKKPYTIHKNFSQEFNLVEKMLNEALVSDGSVSPSLINECFNIGGVALGLQVHGWCIRTAFIYNTVMVTTLINMYLNYGMIDAARRFILKNTVLTFYDVSMCDSIIASFIKHKHYDEAFRVYENMISNGIVMTELIYVRLIRACGFVRDEKYGMSIHGRIIRDAVDVESTSVWNSLVTFYTKCGNVENAKKLFERISRKDVVSWNIIIASSEQNGEKGEAIEFFRRMVKMKFQPNEITFISMLSAVSGLLAINLGREIHGHLIRLGLENDTKIGNCLITIYSRCKEVNKAEMVFKNLVSKDVITWNSLLSGYEQNQQQENYFLLLEEMLFSGMEPDSHTFAIMINAASSDPSNPIYIKRGLAIHGYIWRRMVHNNHREMSLFISNALLAMYAKFNRMSNAETIFMGMNKRDSYSWNAMMDGYSNTEHFEKVFMIFSDARKEGLPLDHLCFSILLTTCGRMASLELGKQFHSNVRKLFYVPNSSRSDSLLSINNAMISMYSKCGSISDATQVFSYMERRDIFSWTAMITGYAHHGMAIESLQLYEKMKIDGVKPNHVTFLGLLLACAHGGFVEKGSHYFQSMTEEYGLEPNIDHYSCMVDIYGRSGQFDLAKNVVELAITTNGNNSKLWRALLGACHVHRQLKLGVEAATRLLEMDANDETTLVTLVNIYASSGLWQDALRVRQTMQSKGLKKETGRSWLDIRNTRHIFVSGDIFQPWRKEIYEKLAELGARIRKVGYVPRTEFVFHDADEAQKEEMIGSHSEKLAVSFGLLVTGTGNKNVIRVMKNLRVCGDCHSWMKITSKVEGREIILRDSRRFHHFSNGSCSCRDFW